MQLLAKNMAATHVHAICTRHLHTPFAYVITRTPYAFFARIILCMYLLYDIITDLLQGYSDKADAVVVNFI